MDPFSLGAMISGGSSLLGSLFGGDDGSDEAQAKMQQAANLWSQSPQDLDMYRQMLGQMMQGNGTNFINNIMGGYSSSPAFKLAQEDMMRATGNAAASAGTLGTFGHQADVANRVNQLGMADRQQWLQNVLSTFMPALQQQGNLGMTGVQNLSNIYGNQGNLAYQSGLNNQSQMGNMFGAAGGVASGLFGVPGKQLSAMKGIFG